MDRREILITGGATAAILGGLGTYVWLNPPDEGDTGVGPDPLPETPAGSATRTPINDTPWNKDKLVVSREFGPEIQDGFNVKNGITDAGFRAAVDWWNQYLDANEPFELQLTYAPQHNNPDILLKNYLQPTFSQSCAPQYDNLGFNADVIRAWMCVETLEEHPDRTPVSGFMDRAGGGPGMRHLLAKHMIGRLIGYDVNTGPIDVMSPRFLAGYDGSRKENMDHALFQLGHPAQLHHRTMFRELAEETQPVVSRAEAYNDRPEGTHYPLATAITEAKTDIEGELNTLTENAQSSIQFYQDNDMPVYEQAARDHYLNGPLATTLRETIQMLDRVDKERPALDADQFQAFAGRIEFLAAQNEKNYWLSDFTPPDILVHLAWADEMWERHMTGGS